MPDNFPSLVSCKPLNPDLIKFKKINITSEHFTLGRALKNSVTIPSIYISRSHCFFYKKNDDWLIEDYSTCGIEVNGDKMVKGAVRVLKNGDVIALETNKEFVYRFNWDDDGLPPGKRVKQDPGEDLSLNDVKTKFQESQNYEIKHMEEKIKKQKQIKETNKLLQKQLHMDMQKKIALLESKFASQIDNLKGEKNEIEKQKFLILEEKDAQISTLKNEMNGKINDLMTQIRKQNEIESELVIENVSLKEKLLKEREEFLLELNRETSSKQDMLDKLKVKMKEQEELRLKEKTEMEDMLRRETEKLKILKEKELSELEEQKQQRELELMQELNKLKENLTKQIEATNELKLKSEEQLNQQMNEMKKMSDADRIKMEQLVKEREDIQMRLQAAEEEGKKKVEELKEHVQEREVELAVLAAQRIQMQTDQSSEVICSLQKQLETVKNQLENVVDEKKRILENFAVPDIVQAGPSKQKTLAEVGEIMENELQCSICAELFVEATTLECSHTFCKYCIDTWKKKKRECPNCRAPIKSECRSLVLDSFIDKMVQNLTDELKKKREDMLKSRKEVESRPRRPSLDSSRGEYSEEEEDWNELDYLSTEEQEEREDDEGYDGYGRWWYNDYENGDFDFDEYLDPNSSDVDF
ncbi:E3 ubiquitin-protein ligase rnf8-B-like isoform X2 [Leptidea sinapis]|uniref:E3 ubiquitin-protein ligase rnf8-B-like isoform X2 n=1 Tax=Leptidea sinapis TaxID=189913 RepID=UPI0021460F72|nr:E3 ubiquitin-protein ligase rnf8-B-like isoform X2 [Leptidea sinapis]